MTLGCLLTFGGWRRPTMKRAGQIAGQKARRWSSGRKPVLAAVLLDESDARDPSDLVFSGGERRGTDLGRPAPGEESRGGGNSSVIAVDTAVSGTTKLAYSVDPQVVSHKISTRCWSQAMAAARDSGALSAVARNDFTARLAQRTAARRVKRRMAAMHHCWNIGSENRTRSA